MRRIAGSASDLGGEKTVCELSGGSQELDEPGCISVLEIYPEYKVKLLSKVCLSIGAITMIPEATSSNVQTS